MIIHMNKTWDELRAETAKLKDKLGMPMDEKIINLVTSLRAHGFTTVMSCEGHTDRITGGPYVIMINPESKKITSDKDTPETRAAARKLTATTAAKLFSFLEEFYKNKTIDYRTHIAVDTLGSSAYRIWCNGSSLLPEREGLSLNEKSNLLYLYQLEMERFSEFLKNKI